MRASLRSDVVNLFGELEDVYNELYGNEKDWKKVSGSGGFMQRLVNEYGLESLAEMEVFHEFCTFKIYDKVEKRTKTEKCRRRKW